MKTYLKILGRMFKKHISRFLSIILIILVSVGFTSGLGASASLLDNSMTDLYKSANVGDLVIKTSASNGFSEDEIAAVKEKYGEENVNTGMSVDVNLEVNGEEQLVRLYFLDEFENKTVNEPEIVETTALQSADVLYGQSEEADNKIKGIAPGTEISLDFADILAQLAEQNGEELPEQTKQLLSRLKAKKVTVSSVVRSPLTFSLEGEPSYKNPEDIPMPETVVDVNNMITVDNILYLPFDAIPTYADIMPILGNSPLLARGDLYVAFTDREEFNAFSLRYKEYLTEQETELLSILNGEEINFISLYDNYSFYSLHSYSEKVLGLGILFMVVFIFITALVVFSNMSRLIEEERAQIACLETMGYTPLSIVSRYALFSLIATGIGGVGAYFIGIGLSSFIYLVFNYSFVMPAMTNVVTIVFFLITSISMVLCVLASTVWAGGRMAAKTPATLLRPRAPRAGRKVILEKIPLIWNRLSFKYKSTFRNVLRYKSRFIMTVVSVAGAMGLILAGLSLLDLCLFGEFGSAAIIGLAVLIVVFAGLLTVVIVYTLTNINVAERNREIATLMVLGYYDGEVSGYIFREVYINTAIGIVLGYIPGVFLMWLLFSIMGFGSLGSVGWYVWLLAPVIVLLFTAIVTLILRHKIVSVHMNESLKAIE